MSKCEMSDYISRQRQTEPAHEVEQECPYCDEFLQSLVAVQSHSDQENLSYGPQGFVCEVFGCNAIFTVRSLLVKH